MKTQPSQQQPAPAPVRVQPVVRRFIGDIQPIHFTVEHDPSNDDQPWGVWRDDGLGDTHHTLDAVLFWELVIGDRVISEKLRARINREMHPNADAINLRDNH